MIDPEYLLQRYGFFTEAQEGDMLGLRLLRDLASAFGFVEARFQGLIVRFSFFHCEHW
jgi:hypothetical protein